MLDRLYQAHMGIEKTRPHINKQIKNIVKKDSTCQENQRKQHCEPMKASNVPQYTLQMVGSYLFN